MLAMILRGVGKVKTYAGAMLIFSVSFQIDQVPEGDGL